MQIIWKNGSFRKRKNLHYQKIADLVLLSLFMRTNESATILMPPSTGLSGILLSPEPNVHEGPEDIKKYQHYIDAPGETNST